MEINVPVEELRQYKVMIGTPMYGAQCSGMYTRSMAELTTTMQRYGVPMQFYFLFNESLITRARNYCVDEFMRSDCTHLMFIDSDISFKAQDVLSMLAIMHQRQEMDVCCAPYPKKTIAWEKITQAVKSGVADEDPNVLENFVGDYVFNPIRPKEKGEHFIKLSEPTEVAEGGTGFMMIKRETFDKYKETYPQFMYRPDHVRTAHFDGSTEIMAYFDALIDDKSQNLIPEIKAFFKKNPNAKNNDVVRFLEDKTKGIDQKQYSNRYLSEDYMFCYNVRRAGMKVFMCPWMELKHMGAYVFGGSLAALASVGAAATADPEKLGKKKG